MAMRLVYGSHFDNSWRNSLIYHLILCLLSLYVFSVPESAAEGNTRVKYKVMDFPVSLPFQKPAPDKPNPKQGIG